MEDQPIENAFVRSITFFGNAAPTSGELLVTVSKSEKSDTPNTQALTLPNFSEKYPKEGPEKVHKAVRKLVKAYMLSQKITLRWRPMPNSLPWITSIDYDGHLDTTLPRQPKK